MTHSRMIATLNFFILLVVVAGALVQVQAGKDIPLILILIGVASGFMVAYFWRRED